MRRYLLLTATVFAAYVLLFSVGCNLFPSLDDPHSHDQAADQDEQAPDTEPAVAEELLDPDLMGQPPEVQEAIKAASVDDALGVLARAEDDRMLDPHLMVSYVYRHASEPDRRRIEQTAAELAQSSEHAMVRIRCIGLLSGFDNGHYDLRVQAARSDVDEDVRIAAISTLPRQPAAAMPILRELTRDASPAVRQTAQDMLTRVMADLGDEGVRALVRELGIYRNDASALAAIALVVRGEVSLPYLIDAAMNDYSPHRRAAAASCIAMICAGNNPYLDEFAERAQATTHADRAPARREANLDGLEPLLYVLRNDTYGPAREIAAQGLGYLGSEKAVPALAAALSDPHHAVRRRAAAALETLPAAPATKHLAHTAISDKVPEVRGFAVRALGNIGTDEAIAALARATADPEPTVRESAADELGRLRAVQAFEALIGMFGDPDDDTRWAAVRAVGSLRTEQAIPYLVDALRDPVPQVANAAERGLQQLGIAKRKPTGFREPEAG